MRRRSRCLRKELCGRGLSLRAHTGHGSCFAARGMSLARVLRPTDIEPTARVLARAFGDNPVYSFLHPRASTRATDLESFFRRNLAWRDSLGLTWVACDAGGEVIGTVTLEPPGGVSGTFSATWSHWVVPTWREQGARGVARLAWTDAEFARHNREVAGQRRYWHVHAVAVDPRAQGRGVGMSMMTAVLAELTRLRDRDPAPVVLSTQRESNVHFYRRLGFETVKHVDMLRWRSSSIESWFLRLPT
jgi:predicted N-acetyltransferase YhbS